jgi:hypothetical protein
MAKHAVSTSAAPAAIDTCSKAVIAAAALPGSALVEADAILAVG